MVPNPIFLMDDLGGFKNPYFWKHLFRLFVFIKNAKRQSFPPDIASSASTSFRKLSKKGRASEFEDETNPQEDVYNYKNWI